MGAVWIFSGTTQFDFEILWWKSTDELKIKVEVETLKPAEPTEQTSVSAVESAEYQRGQHQEASAAPVTLGDTQPTVAEVLQAPNVEEILRFIASTYLQTSPPRSKDDLEAFLTYMKEIRQVFITRVDVGSLVITVKCVSLQILEDLWEDYSSGHLGEVVQKCFVTEDFLKELNLAELKLKTTMEEEEYKACRVYFVKNALRG